MNSLLKKLPIAIGSIVIMASSANSFEFPDKLPYGEISANVNFASSYIWRGEVQNGNNPAIQGGFDYSADIVSDYISAYAEALLVFTFIMTEYDILILTHFHVYSKTCDRRVFLKMYNVASTH